MYPALNHDVGGRAGPAKNNLPRHGQTFTLEMKHLPIFFEIYLSQIKMNRGIRNPVIKVTLQRLWLWIQIQYQ